MSSIFKLEKVTDEVIVLSVHAFAPYDVALHPYVEQKMQYISVTRGDDLIITAVYEDGSLQEVSPANKYFGEKTQALLWDKVYRFVHDECRILPRLTYTDTPDLFQIYEGSAKSFILRITKNGKAHTEQFFDVGSVEEMMKITEEYFGKLKWRLDGDSYCKAEAKANRKN